MTKSLDRALAGLNEEFADEIAAGEITHIGTFNCRRKNNKPGAPWSEHSWTEAGEKHKGNAADVHVKTKDGAVGDRLAKWMRSRPDLWAEVFWKIALHHDHVHGTAAPRLNYDNRQVPPCAGGDEVEMSLKRGDKGNAVAKFQKALNAWNPNLGLGVDKDFGPATEGGVKAYQHAADLAESGEIDGVTAALLLEYVQDIAGGGESGPPGPKGDTGPQGPPGPAPTSVTFGYE